MDRAGLRSRWSVWAVFLVLVSGACSTGKGTVPAADRGVVARPGAADAGVLKGSGASLGTGVMERWVREYKAVAPGVTIDFREVGPGPATEELRAGAIDFVLSESPGSAGRSGDLVAVPVLGSAVVVAYNLPGVSGLRLSPSVLAGLFGGSVTSWDDPRVAADNPGTSLPAIPVKAYHRSDPDGATAVLSGYLTDAVPGQWTVGPEVTATWPAGRGADGPGAMIDSLRRDAGALGYAAAEEARGAGLGMATVRNAAGTFSGPTADAVGTFLISSVGTPDDLVLVPSFKSPAPLSYPLSTFTYLLVRNGEPATAKQTALRNFLRWVLSEGQRSIDGAGRAPLPLPLLVRTLEALQSEDLRPRR